MSTRRKIITLSLSATLVLGIAASAAEASPTPRAHVVHPGESIQAAIDRAPAHGTVVVSNGTYAENLLVTKPVTVIGDDVTLVPPETPRRNACLTSPEDRLPGFCVLGDITIPGPETTPIINGYLDDVRIVGLRITGFPGSGVFAYATDHLVVTGTELDHNGKDGAISLAGHRTTYTGNRVHDNGVFGLTIEDAPDARASITFNQVAANNGVGILVRDSDQAIVAANSVSANCAGILALSTYAPATGMTISFNRVTANNRFCPANEDGYPAFSGIGIGLAGAPDAKVVGNVSTGHVPHGGTDLPSGDIVNFDDQTS
jgi:nitrous oxidase accessory protein NosD